MRSPSVSRRRIPLVHSGSAPVGPPILGNRSALDKTDAHGEDEPTLTFAEHPSDALG